MSRIEAMIASMLSEGKSVEIPTRSQEIDASVDGKSNAPSMDPSDLLKSDQLDESMEDEEDNIPLQALEESPKLIIDDLVHPAPAKGIPSLAAHQVIDELSTPTESMEIEVSKGIKDNIPLQSLLPGNSSLDRVMLPTHELGNGEGATNICDELLCFDPGGEGLLIASYGLLRLLLKSKGNGSILVKESASRVAHQVLDKMSPPMESNGDRIGDDLTSIRADVIDLFQLHFVFDPGIVEKKIEVVAADFIVPSLIAHSKGGGDYLIVARHGLIKEVPKPPINNQVVTKGFTSLLASQLLEDAIADSLHVLTSDEMGYNPREMPLGFYVCTYSGSLQFIFDPGIIAKGVDAFIPLVEKANMLALEALEDTRVMTYGYDEALPFDPGGVTTLMLEHVMNSHCEGAVETENMNEKAFSGRSPLLIYDVKEQIMGELSCVHQVAKFKLSYPHQFVWLSMTAEPPVVWFSKEIQPVMTDDDKGQLMGLDKCSYPCSDMWIFDPGGGECQGGLTNMDAFKMFKPEGLVLILDEYVAILIHSYPVAIDGPINDIFGVILLQATDSGCYKAVCTVGTSNANSATWGLKMLLPCFDQMKQMMQTTATNLGDQRAQIHHDSYGVVAPIEDQIPKSITLLQAAEACYLGLLSSLSSTWLLNMLLMLYHEQIIMCKEGATYFVFDPGGQRPKFAVEVHQYRSLISDDQIAVDLSLRTRIISTREICNRVLGLYILWVYNSVCVLFNPVYLKPV